ncbi:MAG TPA: hypothetical protein VNR00_06435 [Opitutus sp.]|nr:hypothetical protein [Opitutus sp.]
MTPTEALRQHQLLCDELHQFALEENRFLRQHQRPLASELLERKRTLLTKLDESLSALRTVPAGRVKEPETRDLLEQTRARILQILQLDKENEQLLLRYSLTGPRPAATPASPSSALLQKIYSRIS